MSLPNRWHLRRVADSAAKACLICLKPTSSVLITSDSKDFFYICPAHLKDRGFCIPVVDTEAIEKAKREEKEREIEKVKKEYEEKVRRKEEGKKKEKEKEKEGEEAKKDDEKEKKKDSGKESEDKKPSATPPPEEPPRVFTLHKTFFQQRLDRLRAAEVARRNKERLRNPTTFPSVPRGEI
ncbi:MAG: hypothetical protein M1817_003977 [Caeruleum heppii]|nr:MAG: hypothetical protein M1817_003977 [Caeruleum heppii]